MQKMIIILLSICTVGILVAIYATSSSYSTPLSEEYSRITFDIKKNGEYVFAVEFEDVSQGEMARISAIPLSVALTFTDSVSNTVLYDENVTIKGISLEFDGRVYREINRLFINEGEYIVNVRATSDMSVLKEFDPVFKVMKLQ